MPYHASKDWVPISDHRIRVGLVGHGLCKFAAAFGFQDHPNVEVVAVSDLFPDRYRNPFGTEIALFRTSEGGSARMAVSWDSPGQGGEMGRVRGQRGSFYGKYGGLEKSLPDTRRPPLRDEGPRAAEDPAVQNLTSHHRILIRRFVACESRPGS